MTEWAATDGQGVREGPSAPSPGHQRREGSRPSRGPMGRGYPGGWSYSRREEEWPRPREAGKQATQAQSLPLSTPVLPRLGEAIGAGKPSMDPLCWHLEARVIVSDTRRLPCPGLRRTLTQPMPPQATSTELTTSGTGAGHRRGQPRVTAVRPAGVFPCLPGCSPWSWGVLPHLGSGGPHCQTWTGRWVKGPSL